MLRASEIADLLKIPHLTSSHTAGLHDQHYLASQSLSRQADVVAALASPRLLQLYAAVVAGLLFRELRNSRPFLYKCVVQLAHWLCYSICFDLATLAIVYFRPPGDKGAGTPPETAAFLVRDFWLAFIGHAFVAFAGAYSVLLLDGEMTVINAVQAQAATGAVLVIGPEASMALLGGAATEFVALGDGENANNANNQDHEHGQGGGPSFLAKIASSVAGLLGINISSASATTLIGVVMRNYSSIPILSTGLAWLFLMHHHTPIELLPLVIFPCVETAAAWHGRNVAPWFSSASRLAFIVVLINGWYNGTASWGLTPFLLLCLGKPFLLLLFLSATGPVMVCQLLGKFAVRAWRKAFPPPGVALANEGPRIHYPGAAETGDQPAAAPVDPSASSAGGSSVREEGRRRVEDDERRERERRRRDELLDELDDLIEDARKMGVDASYRTPLHAGTSAESRRGASFTRSRRSIMLAAAGRTGSPAGSAPGPLSATAAQRLPAHAASRPVPTAAVASSSLFATPSALKSTAAATPASPPPPPPSTRTGDECVYCWNSARSVLLEPCAHLCLCDGCRELLASKGETRCPVCRREVTMYRKIFRA